MDARDKIFCIYAHINTINSKIYIGQTKDTIKRWFPSNYKGCTKFYYAIKKYGWENFKHIILINNLTLEEANIIEEELIKKYNTIEQGYNLKSGGLNNLYSKDSKKKMKDNHHFNKIICVETKKVYDNAVDIERLFGYKETNIISCCKHNLHTAYGYHWEYFDENFDYNNYTPATQDKRKRKVYCKELDKVFDSAAQASRELNIARPNISHCCAGKIKSAGGYHWSYYEEE